MQTVALTPLQQSAIERIQFFQEALKKRGLFVRLAYEQEFGLQATDGTPLEALKKDKLPSASFSKPKTFGDKIDVTPYTNITNALLAEFPSLSQIVEECGGTSGRSRLYEAKFDGVRTFTPLDVTHDTQYFRYHGLDALKRHSCLTSENARFLIDSLPYPHIANLEKETIDLHANTSVYNSDGKNLYNNPLFMEACEKELLNLQHKAGLGFLQSQESLQRISANQTTPKFLIASEGTKTQGYSICVRGDKNDRYTENRLMGGNADLYVVTALELAAIYNTIKKQPALMNVSCEPTDDRPAMQAIRSNNGRTQVIETDIGIWQKRFADSEKELQPLLGDALYAGIKNTYGVNRSGR